jgi:hypothetical protein
MIDELDRIINLVGIYIWQGKAYLPEHAQFESGRFVDIEPVYVVEISNTALVKAVRTVKDAGFGYLPDPESNDEFRKRKDPILSNTGARSWKQLARTGASYSISWTKRDLRIDMSMLDNKGRWIFDPAKVILLLPDVPI